MKFELLIIYLSYINNYSIMTDLNISHLGFAIKKYWLEDSEIEYSFTAKNCIIINKDDKKLFKPYPGINIDPKRKREYV